MSAVSTASANKKFHIAKFGGTSVANFETMYILNKLQDARQDRERGLLFVSSAG